jgi:hypothetical protein
VHGGNWAQRAPSGDNYVQAKAEHDAEDTTWIGLLNASVRWFGEEDEKKK